MSENSMQLILVAFSSQVWEQYQSWFKARGLEAPPMPNLGIWVATEELELVAGTGLFPSDGPYIMVENTATNPAVPATLAHAAIDASIQAIRVVSAVMGKVPCCFPHHRSIFNMLQRHGFTQTGAVVMATRPLAVIGAAEIPKAQQNRSKDGNPGSGPPRAPRSQGRSGATQPGRKGSAKGRLAKRT